MPTIVLETVINAPLVACFDLARDLALHTRTVAWTRERVVEGPDSGLFGPGDSVTFEAVHFGVRQRLTARMVEWDPPRLFAEEMTQGAFQRLYHRHEFSLTPDGGTLMTDTLEFTSPFGVIGVLADKVFLERYMTRFLQGRNRELKRIAESGEYHGQQP